MITENYIKMCEQAKDLQKAWKPKLGDTCLNRFDGKEVIIIEKGVGVVEYKVLFMDVGLKTQRNYWYSKVNLKWLPTQKQLQEILFEGRDLNFADWFKIFCDRYFYVDDYGLVYLVELKDETKKFHSFVELWLNLVMEEKYHKTWTGKNWVKK